MPARRAVLALAGGVLTSGCLFIGPNCRWGHRIRAVPLAELDLPVDAPTGTQQELVETALDEGQVTVSTYRARPLEDGAVFDYRGTYYVVRLVDHERTEEPALRLNVRARTDETIADDQVRALDTLPAPDRRALEMLLHGEELGRPTTPGPSFSARDVPVPYPNGTDDSFLAESGPVWIRDRDREFHVAVAGEVTIQQDTRTFELEDLGTTPASVQEYLVPEETIAVADLPADERAIVEEAIADGPYETCEETPPAVESLEDRLADADHAVVPEMDDRWVVEHEGSIYALTLRQYGGG